MKRKIFVVTPLTCVSNLGCLNEVKRGITLSTLDQLNENILDNFSKFALICEEYHVAKIKFFNHSTKIKRIENNCIEITECVVFKASVGKKGKLNIETIEDLSDMVFDFVEIKGNKVVNTVYCTESLQEVCLRCACFAKKVRKEGLISKDEKIGIRCGENILFTEEDLYV